MNDVAFAPRVSAVDAYRHVPYDIEVEQALLGALLIDSSAVERVSLLLRPEQFYDPLHQRLFEAIVTSFEPGGIVVTPLTLHAQMKADPGLLEVGGLSYLANLAAAAPALPNVRDYARILHDLWVRRALIHIGEDIVNTAYETPLENSPPAQIRAGECALQSLWRTMADGASGLPILDSAEFVSGFTSPDYLLDGVLQRGFLYSNTGQTGTGKTALALRLLAHAALGKPIAGREMQQCPGLMLVGENADDVRARWIALGEQMGFIPRELPVHFVPSIFSVGGALPILKQRASDVGGFGLIVVDTSAAYFEGDEENSNKQLGDHARALRTLTSLDGRPCVVANCHPTKGAGEGQLSPRGGGAYLAEVDGNLTSAKKDGCVELHWQGKFRGPDFDPIAFELLTVHSDLLRDSRGRHVPTVIAHPLSHDEQVAHASNANRDLHRLVRAMAEKPGASIAELAQAAGWIGSGGLPMKSKVSRLLNELKRNKLANKGLDSWELTPAGTKLAQRGEK